MYLFKSLSYFKNLINSKLCDFCKFYVDYLFTTFKTLLEILKKEKDIKYLTIQIFMIVVYSSNSSFAPLKKKNMIEKQQIDHLQTKSIDMRW